MGSKYYVSVDLEGVACAIGTPGQGLAAGTPNYAFACEQATRETKATVDALFAGGAEEVFVWDCHGSGYNLDYRALDSRVKIVMGAGSRKRFPGLTKDFSGVLFLGYHAYDAKDATLCHVYSSATYSGMKVEGKDVGELQIDAAIAGKSGVPVLFVASDNVCVAQARETFPNAVFVETKQALAWNSCISKHPEAVCGEISDAVERAMQSEGTVYTFPSPFSYEVTFKRIEYAQGCSLHDRSGHSFGWKGAYTRFGALSDPEEIFLY